MMELTSTAFNEKDAANLERIKDVMADKALTGDAAAAAAFARLSETRVFDRYHSSTFRGLKKSGEEGSARATGYIRHSEDGKWRLIGDWFEIWPDDEPWDGLFFAELKVEQS